MINNAIIQINRMSSFKSRQRLDISNFVFLPNRHIVVVVDRPNCMDFIYRRSTEFEGVKVLFWQL